MIDLNDVEAARRRIRDFIELTPCASSEPFGEMFGGHAWFKLENLQRTGSFKERGALNRILTLSPEDRARGVIAASAGNHAQGVAFHAGRLGVTAVIVMPERTPLVKVTQTEKFGARVILHGANYDEAMDRALQLRDEQGLVLVHPFDDPLVIAGQGTIALEILEQCPEVEVVVAPVGGGGLISGIGVALKALRPSVRLVGVEAAMVPSANRAREMRDPIAVPPAETIADGIAVRRVGDLTFPLIERYVDDLVTVGEEAIASAVLLLLEREKTVSEPASAATVAAVVRGDVADVRGRNVVMVLSGGNIDVNLLSRIIERGLVNDGRLAHLDVLVEDRPGSLAALTALVAEQGANILQLDHRRGMGGVWLTDVAVELTLETRGRAHVRELVHALHTRGYRVRSE